jgi:hypothetical protein
VHIRLRLSLPWRPSPPVPHHGGPPLGLSSSICGPLDPYGSVHVLGDYIGEYECPLCTQNDHLEGGRSDMSMPVRSP